MVVAVRRRLGRERSDADVELRAGIRLRALRLLAPDSLRGAGQGPVLLGRLQDDPQRGQNIQNVSAIPLSVIVATSVAIAP